MTDIIAQHWSDFIDTLNAQAPDLKPGEALIVTHSFGDDGITPTISQITSLCILANTVGMDIKTELQKTRASSVIRWTFIKH